MDHVDRLQAQVEVMPAMDALRWSLSGLNRLRMATESPVLARAMRFVDQWLQHPDESGRMAALEQAEKLGYDGPAGWLFASVAWTGSSMVDPRISVVEPPPRLASKAACSAVLTALFEEDDETREQLLETFVEETVPYQAL